ncbi:MAG: DUF2799 domain-containing protein [Alphaproteobacteria bacterium]|nr:DUF2799 domain-containing protein [Alphaproteobacteria bacterium]
MKKRSMVVALAALSGCATMSADQCASADWSALGMKDGNSGETLKMADNREAACAKAGVTIDRVAYTSGRSQGLVKYCTPAHAFEIGSVNGRYDGVCVDHNETDFLVSYKQGMALAEYKSGVATARSRVSDAAVEIASITEAIDGYASGATEFEAENHNEKVLLMWSKRKYLQNEVIPFWQAEVRRGEKVLDRFDQRGVYGFDVAELAASKDRRPRPYVGPTEQEAREMFSEVFANAASKLRQTSAN